MNLFKNKHMTLEQKVAFVCIFLMALWMSGLLWFSLTRPLGAHQLEILILGTLAPISWVLVVLYLFRVRWSYPAGILVALVLLAGGIKAVFDDTLFFSISIFNILTILFYAIICTEGVFSYRAFRQGPPKPWWQTALGIAGTLLVMGGLVWLLSANHNSISRLNAQWALGRLKGEISQLETLDEKAAYLAVEGDLPSAVVGIVVDDELVWSGAYGEGANLDAVYNMASIAKPVTATAVLQLVDRGLIDLDEDISSYLPFEVRHPEYPAVTITPRMILGHQSGIGHYTPTYFAYHMGDEILDWEETHRGETIYGPLERIESKPQLGAFLEAYLVPGGSYHTPQVWANMLPGTGYQYSTVGYDLLGYLVEQVTGQPYEAYLQQNIFGPLQMSHTGQLAVDEPDGMARPYERVYSVLGRTNVELPRYGSEVVGGGGLSTTLADLSQFLIAHMNEGSLGNNRILEPETSALMHTRSIRTSADIGMAASGYGWTIRQEEPWIYWGFPYQMRGAQGHGGADYGYRSSMFYVEEEEGGYGVIILTNLDNLFKEDMLWYFAIYLQLEDLLMDEAYQLWAAEHD